MSRWTPISFVEKRGSHEYWLYKCECGKEKIVRKKSVEQGGSLSCGCLSKELTISRQTTHGDYGTRLYKIWIAMKSRCSNPKTVNYEYYGGKGIKVCEEWKSYDSFKKWALENGYTDGLTIDRKYGDGDYEPNNCRWVTHKEQNRNLSSNYLITINGVTKCMSEWCELNGMDRQVAHKRIKRGMDPIEAVTKKVRKYGV
ncbi:hypothetical protein [Bacillus thuringiensis]|uniref:hypothetical protein n=1 Tax=Bacillus thuringiensis TaxID=1428 RepID=UPI000BF3E3D9|nr:hypothetical protein [Bacillus thuringiensis]PFA83974.1 hypothetical protein CN400_16315 [Bacillus thuringiensis]